MKIKIRLAKPLGDHKVGKEFLINCDNNGIPLDFFWKKRFQAAFRDKSLLIIAESENFNHNRYKLKIVYETLK